MGSVLMLADLGGTGRRWDAVASRLSASGHQVAAVDWPGGAGVRTADSSGLAAFTAHAAAAAGRLGSRPVVVGHGFGAAISLQLAVDHPDVARAHVWIEGGFIDLAGRFADGPTAAAALVPFPLSERMLRAQHDDWEEAAIAGVLADVTVDPGAHSVLVEQWWRQHPAALYPRVTAPVMIVTAVSSVGSSTTRWAQAEELELASASRGLRDVRMERISGDANLPAGRPAAVAELVGREAGS